MTNANITIGPGHELWEDARRIVREIATSAVDLPGSGAPLFNPQGMDDLQRIALELAGNPALAASTACILSYWMGMLMHLASAVYTPGVIPPDDELRERPLQLYQELEERMAAGGY